MRIGVGRVCLVLAIASVVIVAAAAWWWRPALWAYAGLGPLLAWAVIDRLQRRHTILRIYPIVGHFRYWLERIGPELHQYFVESDSDGRPFSREQRSIVYERAKDVPDVQPFGTVVPLKIRGAECGLHSIRPAEALEEEPRVRFGPDRAAPYDASRLNISAMSFGSLGPNAIRALNHGARLGGFAHDTGEGGISRYHLEAGADLVWEIGSGYFGCRGRDGSFDEGLYVENARRPEVRMIELKLSQGAKPGHGGVLPGVKVTPEIARARGVEPYRTCVSPPRHSTFDSPRGLLEFIERLREGSGGKPTGFKLCVGRPEELLGICKAMLETGLRPDFITVDGAEGGTGAAPFELSDSVGMPLRQGLVLVDDALVGSGLRPHVRIVASGKIISGFDMVRTIALGADTCNSARGMMFALGCIQARRCHDDTCPTGITTQDPWRQRALSVKDKTVRVRNFHRNTIRAFLDVLAAMGVSHPDQLRRRHVQRFADEDRLTSCDEVYAEVEPGAFLDGGVPTRYREAWERADPASFGSG